MNTTIDKLRICTLNVRGLTDPAKVQRLFIHLKQHKYDIVYLQETHLIGRTEADNLSRLWYRPSFWTHHPLHPNQSRSAGTAILFGSKFNNNHKDNLVLQATTTT